MNPASDRDANANAWRSATSRWVLWTIALSIGNALLGVGSIAWALSAIERIAPGSDGRLVVVMGALGGGFATAAVILLMRIGLARRKSPRG